MHRTRYRRGQNLDAPRLRAANNDSSSPGKCSIDKCDKTAISKRPGSLCSQHHRTMKKRGNPLSAASYNVFKTCTITGCDRPYKNNGMCNPHVTKGYKFGLSCMQLDMIYSRGKCDSCGRELSLDKMVLDHDHSCCDSDKSGSNKTCGMCFRGVLCGPCNTGLGMFGDDMERMDKAILYLERHIVRKYGEVD